MPFQPPSLLCPWDRIPQCWELVQLDGGAGRGYSPFLLLQLNTRSLGAGQWNGTSRVGGLGGFNPSGTSLALLNISVQNQSQRFPAPSLGAGGTLRGVIVAL